MRELVIEKIKRYVESKNGSYQFESDPNLVSLDIRDGGLILSYLDKVRSCQSVNLAHMPDPGVLFIWEYMVQQEIKENLAQ